MANLIKAVEFDSQLHQKQAMSYVMRSVEIEFQTTRVTLDLRSPLIQMIYRKLDHSNSSVVQCCANTLLAGTERGWIQFTSFLNGLLNIMPTTSHPGILLKCLGDLLFVELRAAIKEAPYHCSYSIRGKPHPFISVTTSCPQLWPRLLALTSQMLQYPTVDCRPHTVDMLKPFIKYCLIVPAEEGFPSAMADKTWSMMISIVHHYLHEAVLAVDGESVDLKVGQDISSLLITLLPCFEMTSSEQAIESTSRVEQLVCCVVKMAPWASHSGVTEPLSDTLQSIACELVFAHEHVALLSLLKSFSLLTKTFPKLLNSKHSVFWLSWMLLRCTGFPSYVTILLSQVKCLVLSEMTKGLLLPLVFPLSVVHAAKCSPSHHQTAIELLVQVKKANSGDEAATFNGSATASTIPTSTSELYSEMCVTAELYYQLCCCPAQKYAWLDSIQHHLDQSELHITEDMCRLLLIVLTSLYLQQETDVKLNTLTTLSKLVKRSPTLCPELLVFVQYLLSQRENKDLSLKVLHLLPVLAAHKVMVGHVVRVIHGLSQRASLFPVIIRLLCKVWLEKDEVFPHLHKLLLAPPPHGTSSEICREITLAKVATVHDICQHRSELHGEEIIGLVLRFVTEFSLQNPSVSAGSNDGAMAMAVQSLHWLCSSEMVDFPAAWNIVAPKLKGEKRPKVLAAICDMFALIPALEVDEALQPLYDDVLTFLWNCATSADGSVVEASFKALCHFQPEDFKLAYLPNKLLSQLGCVDIAMEDRGNTPVLSGQQCVQLAAGLCPGGLKGYSDFLVHILANEIEQFFRGVAHLTQKHFPQLEHFLRGSSQKLSKFMSVNEGTVNSVDCYYTGGLLMSFQPAEPEYGSRGYQQQLIVVLKKYTTMWYNCSNTDMSFSSVCLHQLLSLPSSWTTFIQRLYTVYVKSRLLEVCPPNMRDNKTSPGYQQKLWEAECWVRSKLVEQLQVVCDGDHLCYAILSLCGIASTCDTVADTVGTVEGTLAWLRDWTSIAFLDGLLSMLASIAGLGNAHNNISGSNFTFIIEPIKRLRDPTTLCGIVTVAATQVIRHVAVTFSLVDLSASMKDSIVAIATNILSNFSISNRYSILMCYSLCEILLITHHQLAQMMSVLGDAVQLCSVTSCNVLTACVLGGLIPVLCEEGGGAQSVAQKLHRELVAGLALSRYNPTTDQFEAACLIVARATPIMLNAGILTLDDCKACVTLLEGIATKHPKCYVVHLSLGTLLCGLASGCVPNSDHTLHAITTQWMACTQHGDMVLAGLYVAAGSVGCCDVLFSHMLTGVPPQRHLQAIVSTCSSPLFSVLAQGRAQTEEIGHALWLVTQLRRVAHKAISSRQNLPVSYSYLSEERILPAVFDYLSDSREQQPTVVSALLNAVGQCSSLPPAEWTPLLLSITRRTPSMCHSCIQCALKLTKTSRGFHTFIVYCCNPVVLCSAETATQQLILTKLHHLVADNMSAPSLSYLLGSCLRACQKKKELFKSFVEGIRQALLLADLPDAVTNLLHHCVWRLCQQLQVPHILDYTMLHHPRMMADVTDCILVLSCKDSHSASVTMETNIQNQTVLKSLIYSHLISSSSHISHNFLHSCLTAIPKDTSVSHYLLMGLLKAVLCSIPSLNKQELFNFLTHCIQESVQNTYVSKDEAELLIAAALLASRNGRNGLDLWLGFLGHGKLSSAESQLVALHVRRLVSMLLSCLATSKQAPTNLKQLLTQWIVEAMAKNADYSDMLGNYTLLVTSSGSSLWTVWINLV